MTARYPLVLNGTSVQELQSGDTLNATISSATTATNLAGGSASQLPYQTGSGATSFIANGTSGQILTSNGASAPSWQNLSIPSGTTLTNPTITNYTETTYTANTGTAITVALTNGTVQILTLTGNATITMPTAGAGKSFIIFLRQDATGSRTVTWSTVNWAGGTAPTITSTASKQDIFSFFSDGTSWYGVTVGQNYTA